MSRACSGSVAIINLTTKNDTWTRGYVLARIVTAQMWTKCESTSWGRIDDHPISSNIMRRFRDQWNRLSFRCKFVLYKTCIGVADKLVRMWRPSHRHNYHNGSDNCNGSTTRKQMCRHDFDIEKTKALLRSRHGMLFARNSLTLSGRLTLCPVSLNGFVSWVWNAHSSLEIRKRWCFLKDRRLWVWVKRAVN